MRGVDGLRELWWRPEDKSLRRLHADYGAAAGASFVQVNPVVASELRERVLSLARAARPATVVDAYAGVGEIVRALARDGARVTTIESDRAAVAVGAELLPAGSRAVAGRVEDRLAEALPADVVILNPPRAGLHERVPAVLNAVQPLPRAIVYVSCNPATLARDVRRLDRYQVRSVQGFDMFPQTAHVETACLLEPAA
jgi:23S rRNA (uracil1939-C5)-methyltransferase